MRLCPYSGLNYFFKNMKRFFTLFIVPALALVVLTSAALAPENSGKKKKKASAEEIVLENIATRTSIRKFTQEAVSQEDVEKMLRAGMAAPTAGNRQPWHFVVVDDRETLNEMTKANRNAPMLAKAPLAIIVCGDLSKGLKGDALDFWIQDVSAASENILLAAHALGLGATWTGLYPMMDRVKTMSEILNLPENLVPVNAIVIGHPADSPEPKDKFKQENISYNTYGGVRQ